MTVMVDPEIETCPLMELLMSGETGPTSEKLVEPGAGAEGVVVGAGGGVVVPDGGGVVPDGGGVVPGGAGGVAGGAQLGPKPNEQNRPY